ncbi:MAG: flagellar export chaperone FlgN [Pseudomonadota bacterium]
MTSQGRLNSEAARRELVVVRQALVELRDALATERRALTDPNANELERAAERKRAALGAFELTDIVDVTAQRRPHGSEWDAVLALAEECRHANLTNGALLATRKRHTEKLLGLLRGSDARSSTYSQSGIVASGARRSAQIGRA